MAASRDHQHRRHVIKIAIMAVDWSPISDAAPPKFTTEAHLRNALLASYETTYSCRPDMHLRFHNRLRRLCIG